LNSLTTSRRARSDASRWLSASRSFSAASLHMGWARASVSRAFVFYGLEQFSGLLHEASALVP